MNHQVAAIDGGVAGVDLACHHACQRLAGGHRTGANGVGVGGFLAAVLSFPVVIFTPLLLVVIGYWLVVIVGGADPDNDGAGGGFAGFLGLGGAPASIVLSLLVGVAWFVALVGHQLLGGLPGWLVLAGALVAAWVLSRLAVGFLKRFLPAGVEPSRADFLGLTCVIKTGRVTRTFGQAEVHASDGSSAIVQVRQAGHDDLRAGSIALLFDVDPDGDFFWVVPADIATTPEP